MPLPLPIRVESDRLLIRPVDAADIDDLLLANGDDEVTRFLPYASWRSVADGMAWLERMKKLEGAGTASQLVVIEKASRLAVGTCLLFRYDEGSARAELGYVLGRRHWGRGTMREALAALVTQLFGSGSLRRLEAEVDPRNVASCRLLERLGFRNEGLLRQRWTAKGASYDTRFYGLLGDDWQAARTAAAVPGTRGYAAHADDLIERYEAIGFERKHAALLDLLPRPPARVLDIGAGSGADAAWLAERGHHVVAVEPERALRTRAKSLHPSPSIEWLDDSLPDLAALRQRTERFDLIMLSAAWMHLAVEERRRAMPVLAALLSPGGLIALSLRHGPVPAGRAMFEVSTDETIALARACGLRTVACDVGAPSLQAANAQAGVVWSKLAFVREDAAPQ